MSPAANLVTVAVCTYNRADLLLHCLEGLARQSLPAAQWPLLLVDNNCSDGTAALVERYRPRLPQLRLIREPRQGLSQARNAALEACTTPFLAYLDDDAIPPPTWVEQLAAYLATAPAEVAVVGGPVQPILEAPLPAWLPAWVAGYLTIIDLGPTPRLSASESMFAGANVTFRCAALRQVGGFCPQLGRQGANLMSNEEIYLWQLLRRRGWLCAWRPEIPVRHHVGAERVRYGWFMRRMRAEGRSATVMARLLGEPEGPPAAVYALVVLLAGLRQLLSPRLAAALLRRRLSPALVADHARFQQKLGKLSALLQR